jgi:hypothetical protein
MFPDFEYACAVFQFETRLHIPDCHAGDCYIRHRRLLNTEDFPYAKALSETQ